MKNLAYILIMLFLSCPVCSGKTNENISGNANEKVTNEAKKIKMILDLDTGIDDAMALAYALSDPNIELIGVVTSFGNVTMEESVRNTLGLLDMLNRKDVPVFKGADRATGENETYSPPQIIRLIHGNNGVGNVHMKLSTRTAQTKNGVDFMIESAKKYGKDLYIVAVGPTTNLAELVKREPNLKNMIGKMVIMGGALIVEGNINIHSEANIYNDPIAANSLFTSGMPLTMAGLEVTQRTNLTKKDTQVWRDLGTTSGKFFADMVDFYIDAYKQSKPELAGCALHDPLAVAISVNPDLVKTLSLHMKVGTTKTDWGRTIGDYGKMNDPNPNVAVCVDVKVDEFVNLFKKSLTALFKEN